MQPTLPSAASARLDFYFVSARAANTEALIRFVDNGCGDIAQDARTTNAAPFAATDASAWQSKFFIAGVPALLSSISTIVSVVRSIFLFLKTAEECDLNGSADPDEHTGEYDPACEIHMYHL